MKCCFSVLLILLTAGVVKAQQSIVVKPGENVNEVLSFQQRYSYPSFINGTVVFKDGKTANGRFNYNLITGEIQFLDKADTLSLANETTISQVLLAKDTLVFSNGFVKMITSSASAKLGERTYYKDYVQKPGAYGGSTSATATNTVDFLANRRALQVDHDHERSFVRHTDYVISGKSNEFFAADKKSLSKAFPRLKKEIDNYINTNPVDFKNQDDLRRLCAFIGGLEK